MKQLIEKVKSVFRRKSDLMTLEMNLMMAGEGKDSLVDWDDDSPVLSTKDLLELKELIQEYEKNHKTN